MDARGSQPVGPRQYRAVCPELPKPLSEGAPSATGSGVEGGEVQLPLFPGQSSGVSALPGYLLAGHGGGRTSLWEVGWGRPRCAAVWFGAGGSEPVERTNSFAS